MASGSISRSDSPSPPKRLRTDVAVPDGADDVKIKQEKHNEDDEAKEEEDEAEDDLLHLTS